MPLRLGFLFLVAKKNKALVTMFFFNLLKKKQIYDDIFGGKLSVAWICIATG